MAVLRAKTMHKMVRPKNFQPGNPRLAKKSEERAKGRAKIECENLIISKMWMIFFKLISKVLFLEWMREFAFKDVLKNFNKWAKGKIFQRRALIWEQPESRRALKVNSLIYSQSF